jgi:pyruvate/2-oxoglutarate dehydrogenase complex dihydrolipoamide dehydrogenase (E3) component
MLAKQGKHVAVIERKYIHGACPNIACLLSKNIFQSAKVASYFRRSEEFGIAKDNFKIARLDTEEMLFRLFDQFQKMRFIP